MLEHLRYFQTVARCGSLSAAARVLQISQPGLTAVIKQLEESFGTRLLVRLRTGVSLTSTGEELLRFANESLTRLEEVEHRIKGLESDEVGSFVIGCHESLGAYFLPQWMTRFLESNPHIQLTLSNATSRSVLVRTHLIWSGDRFGRSWRSSATAPVTWGAENEVPLMRT